MDSNMRTTKYKYGFGPGQTVYIERFGDGPYVLVKHTDSMLVKSYKPDPTTTHKNSWQTSTYEIEDNWIVRDKKGNYLQYPTAILTRRKPTNIISPIAVGLTVIGGSMMIIGPIVTALSGLL